MSVAKAFVDTNILLYSIDPLDPGKQAIAQATLRGNWNSMVISTQVLQEFASVAQRKLGMQVGLLRRTLAGFANGEVVQVTASLVDRAVVIADLHMISFWDALIVSAASHANAKILFTEDLNDGQVIEGVTVRNPFAAAKP